MSGFIIPKAQSWTRGFPKRDGWATTPTARMLIGHISLATIAIHNVSTTVFIHNLLLDLLTTLR